MKVNIDPELQIPDDIEIKKAFLYIGSSLSKTKKCLALYKESFISNDLQTAKDFLLESFTTQEHCPDLIILDIPYNNQEHSDFIKWIKITFDNTRIPVIYNETAIQSHQIKELKKLNLIDDVVKIENYCNRLHEKARFLKKTNTYLNQPIVSSKFHSELDNYKLNRAGGFIIKRAIDIILSVVAIIFFIPLFIIIAIAIKLESWGKGPVFYSSYRAGRGFKIFKFYKFRTMIPDADKKLNELADLNIYESNDNETTAFFKVINDPRITKVGSFLRNSSLDELPQLFNVLKGDMSIVGNRPLPLYEAASLTTDEWAERFMAPAGITGLWQISKRGKENMSTEERISLDIDYARNQSLRGDFLIMLKTPTALRQKSNV
jgi:lipopolysaccharide/colanic/teichoic acid biosynthesis glycosyltransferase